MFSSFRASAAPLYSALKILPLDETLSLSKKVFMHSLHHKSLPFALSMYCEKPEHRYSTRYKTAGNYVLPCPTTNRGQCSIKFTGPKGWAEVPNPLKEIAFRKPFSKKLKEHILATIFEEMPPKKKRTKQEDEFEQLNLSTLFETDDENEEFFGFVLAEIREHDSSQELRKIKRIIIKSEAKDSL